MLLSMSKYKTIRFELSMSKYTNYKKGCYKTIKKS